MRYGAADDGGSYRIGMLAHTGRSLGDIAFACGYFDQAHFTGEFRAHAGLSPRAYRYALRFPGSTHLADPAEQNLQDVASILA